MQLHKLQHFGPPQRVRAPAQVPRAFTPRQDPAIQAGQNEWGPGFASTSFKDRAAASAWNPAFTSPSASSRVQGQAVLRVEQPSPGFTGTSQVQQPPQQHWQAGRQQPQQAAQQAQSLRQHTYPQAALQVQPLTQHHPQRQQQPQQQQQLSPAQQQAAAVMKADAPKTVRVRFWLKFHVEYGQVLRIIGSHEQLGAWNLAKAPAMQWSEGDLWQANMDLQAGGVYEYKYVVVEHKSGNAASWQLGSNNVLALQPGDAEVEVYDNWGNSPGAMVLADGAQTTREGKLLSWAGDMATQRSELRRTRLELAQAREEIRVLRAELSVLRMEVAEAGLAREGSEGGRVDLERENHELRLQLVSSQAAAKSAVEEAVRLLGSLGPEMDEPPPLHMEPITVEAGSSGGVFDLYGALGFNRDGR